jgi:hypothetical protein
MSSLPPISAMPIAPPTSLRIVSYTTNASTNGWNNLVTGQTLGSARNDYTGSVGFQFKCASNATCRALGRWVLPGNTQSHVVALCSLSGAVLASTIVPTVGAVPGGFAYANLATPYSMTSGTTYLVLSQESFAGDQFYDLNTTIFPSGLAVDVQNEYGNGLLPSVLWGFGVNSAGAIDNAYGPLDVLYSVP